MKCKVSQTWLEELLHFFSIILKKLETDSLTKNNKIK